MGRKDRPVLFGSLAAGLLASACCIGPLVLSALGLGSFGLGALLTPLRPWFLTATTVFLGIGFYLAYRPVRAVACDPAEACAKPVSRRTQRVTLWGVTAVAVALASYPGWGARLMPPGAAAASPAASPAANSLVVLDVDGMTCTACAREIASELRGVPGVVRTEVSFERRRAEVHLAAAEPEVRPLIAAVQKAGYDARVVATTPGEAPTPPSVTQDEGQLLMLNENLQPLLRDFNAHEGRPRFMAILSPRCPACLHGAAAIRKALLGSKPMGYDLFIVWTPMVEGDDEAAARKAAATLLSPNVRQYFDVSNAVGTHFRRDVFPRATEEMRASLPAGHFFTETLKDRSSDTPEWDIYMFFGRADSWGSAGAPHPDRWVRQVARFAEPGHGPKSLMWENSYADPPVEGELADQLSALARKSKGS